MTVNEEDGGFADATVRHSLLLERVASFLSGLLAISTFSSRPRSQIQAAVASRDHAAKTAINGIGTAVKVGGDGDADL